jgi:hypothetical protein
MAWTSLTFAYGSKLTSAKLTQMQANFAAMAAGDAGAPEITKDALKTTANTTGSSGTLSHGDEVNLTLQDFCFSPNIFGEAYDITVIGNQTEATDTVTAFALHNSNGISSRDYHVRYRYITATDQPFIYAIRDLSTGDIVHLWTCDDPPPGYWGLTEKPEKFIPPIICKEQKDGNHDEIVLFRQDKEFLLHLGEKALKDKTRPHQILSTYEFDTETKIFTSKNLSMI